MTTPQEARALAAEARRDGLHREADMLTEYAALLERQARPALTDEALRKDAERYRWLRSNPEWIGWDHDFRPDEVEREIDAAMGKP